MLSSLPKIITWLFMPFSALFGGIIEIRNWYYCNNLLPVAQLPRPTISIGNLSVGGTGKTPVVRYLADYFHQCNRKVAILTRGYGRSINRMIAIDSENFHLFSIDETGDEPRMLAQNLKNGKVIVDANRLQAAITAIKQFNPDVFLLDDAFQHRKIHRDLDIVTLDATDLWGSRYILPAGKLREPISQLKRGDLLWVTRINQTQQNIHQLNNQLKRFNKPVVFSCHVPCQLFSYANYNYLSPQIIKGKKVAAFCGIANPLSFKQTLINLGAEVLAFRSYRDHQPYNNKEIKELLEWSKRYNTQWLITTEKDMARIDAQYKCNLDNLYSLTIKVEILQGEDKLKNLLKKIKVI